MTTRTVEKVTTEIIYVAEDGKEFKTGAECKEYENILNSERESATLAEVINGIEKADTDEAPFGYGYVDTDRFAYATYKPKTVEEIEALEKAYRLTNSISRDIVGKWICLEFEDNDDNNFPKDGDCYDIEVEPSFEKFGNYCAALGYKFTITKVDDGDVLYSNKLSELRYILWYAVNCCCLKHLRALWTAYCVRWNEEPDTASYDSDIADVFAAYLENDDNNEYSSEQFDEFDLYMGDLLC